MAFAVHITPLDIPASEITFFRAACSVLILLPFASRHKSQWLEKSSIILWVRSLIGSISVLCFAWNLQHTSVGLANTLFNLAPIAVVLIGAAASLESVSLGRFFQVALVVVASAIFWHGSRQQAGALIWTVGIVGMIAAGSAYTMLKLLPSSWSATDITWCLNVALLPVALILKNGSWNIPDARSAVLLASICILSVASNTLANISFRHIELSTAAALVPSSIIWGVGMDVFAHRYPRLEGIAGCVLYGVAMSLMVRDSPRDLSDVEPIQPPRCEEAP